MGRGKHEAPSLYPILKDGSHRKMIQGGDIMESVSAPRFLGRHQQIFQRHELERMQGELAGHRQLSLSYQDRPHAFKQLDSAVPFDLLMLNPISEKHFDRLLFVLVSMEADDRDETGQRSLQDVVDEFKLSSASNVRLVASAEEVGAGSLAVSIRVIGRTRLSQDITFQYSLSVDYRP